VKINFDEYPVKAAMKNKRAQVFFLIAMACCLWSAPGSSQNLLSGQNLGMVGGVVGGGVIGSKLAGKKNKTLGTIGGAVGGGVLGGVAGNMYDNRAGQGKTVADPKTTGSIGSGSSLLTGQNLGIVGGAVAGGVVGNKLGGKKNKALGTVGGVVGGGVLGGAVGTMFDKR
jgi:uncharacterized protein YcfJ